MLRFSFSIFGLFLWLLSGVSDAAPRPFWPIPPLSNFDGARWGDLQLGQTTFKQIQSRYETGKGAYTLSTELTQPKTAPIRVDLLWQKRGELEVLSAITVRFETAPRRDEVEPLFAPKAATPLETETSAPHVSQLFWPGRSEDWSVLHFAPRGVAVFALRHNDLETAPLLLLTSPQRLRPLAARLSSEVQPVTEPFDPHAKEPKIMEFGTISISLDRDLELSERERDRTKELVKDAYAGGTIRYVRGARGTYLITMTGSKKRDSGSVSISVSIEGNGPYGALSASGSAYDSWKWTSRDDERDRDYKVIDAYRDALRDAMREAETKFARAMNNSGPPSLDVVRQAQWTQIIEDVRAFEPQNAAIGNILR
ncbi:MAG TPA: hypothetical protein VF627_02330 [Abditibacterium sp.]